MCVVGLLALVSVYMRPRLPPAGGARPHIVGVPIERARDQMRTWVEAAVDASGELRASKSMYEMSSGDSVGTVALMHDDEIRALVLLEKIRPGSTHIWSINCADRWSGSLMVSSLCRVPHNLTLASTVHPRWRIAFAFFASDDDEAEDGDDAMLALW